MDGKLFFHDASSAKSILTIPFSYNNGIITSFNSLSLNADGYCAVGTNIGSVLLYDLRKANAGPLTELVVDLLGQQTTHFQGACDDSSLIKNARACNPVTCVRFQSSPSQTKTKSATKQKSMMETKQEKDNVTPNTQKEHISKQKEFNENNMKVGRIPEIVQLIHSQPSSNVSSVSSFNQISNNSKLQNNVNNRDVISVSNMQVKVEARNSPLNMPHLPRVKANIPQFQNPEQIFPPDMIDSPYSHSTHSHQSTLCECDNISSFAKKTNLALRDEGKETHAENAPVAADSDNPNVSDCPVNVENSTKSHMNSSNNRKVDCTHGRSAEEKNPIETIEKVSLVVI